MATQVTETPNAKPFDVNKLENELKQLKWPPGHKYGGPCLCKATICGEVPMKYIQPAKPQSYKPTSKYEPPCENFPQDTVYKKSYEPIDRETQKVCRPQVGRPKENLTACGPFDGDTTHRMSYGPIPNPERSERYYPHEHNLRGHGPMQDTTTHKHDFTPKPIKPPRPYKVQENIGMPETPMEKRTTHRLSYTPIDLKSVTPPQSYRPRGNFTKPFEPFPHKTVYRTSYLPAKPETRPPRSTPAYIRPSIPMSGRTIYTGSFMAPGEFVEDSSPAGDGKGCYCVYPGECIVENAKKAHDYTDVSTDTISAVKNNRAEVIS